jgi:hypothetical protein
MLTTYALYDDANRKMEHFAGPCRLASWMSIPTGWTIERFLGDVSQGMVSFDDVLAHSREVRGIAVNRGPEGSDSND